MKTLGALGSLACCAVVTSLGCGPVADSDVGSAPPEEQAVGQYQEPLSILDHVPPGVKKAAGLGKEIAGMISGVKEGIAAIEVIGQLFGWWDSKPDPFAELTNQLNTGLLAVSWQSTMQHVDLARSYANNAMGSLREQPIPFDPNSPAGALLDSNSRMAATLLGVNFTGAPDTQNSGFMRFHVEAATDGPWKKVIAERPGTTPKPGDPASLLVYDWRLGVPALLDVVAKRTAAIAGSDPQFATQAHKRELLDMRKTVQAHYAKIVDNVKCNYDIHHTDWLVFKPPALPTASDFQQPRSLTRRTFKARIACADIHTGTSMYDEQPWPDPYVTCKRCTTPPRGLPVCTIDSACVNQTQDDALNRIQTAMAYFRREINQKLPLFEMQSVVNDLYFYANAERDFTKHLEQISLEAMPPNLCLDTGTAVFRNWEGSPVKVEHCRFTNEQWFRYDRRTGVIHNPAHDVCLQVRPPSDVVQNDIHPSAPVHVAACSSPLQPRQVWSYDPERKQLSSAFGTVLEVKSGQLQPGTPVWLWDANNTVAQRWRADQPFTAQASAPTSCGVLRAGEGFYAGQSLASCDGRFNLRLNHSGELSLYHLTPYNPPGLPPGQLETMFWSTSTAGLLGSMLVMQGDGNVVLYNWMGGSVWHTNTWNRPGATFHVQNDGNLVVYDTAGRAVWASNTCCR